MWGTERMEYKGRIIEIFENAGQYWGYVNGRHLYSSPSRGQTIEFCKDHIDSAEDKENQ